MKKHFRLPPTKKKWWEHGIIRRSSWTNTVMESVQEGGKGVMWLEIESAVLKWDQEDWKNRNVISTKIIYTYVAKTKQFVNLTLTISEEKCHGFIISSVIDFYIYKK